MNRQYLRGCLWAIVAVVCLAGMSNRMLAQGGTIQAGYGGPGGDAARGGVLYVREDNTYISVGESRSYSGNGTSDVYIVRTDCCGNPIWLRVYDISRGGNDFGRKIREVPDGFVIIGTTEQLDEQCPTVGSDVFVMKIDRDGNVQWTRIYGGFQDDQGEDIEAFADGNELVAVGYTQSFGAGDQFAGDDNYDAFIMKLDAGGNVIWARTYGGDRFDAFHGLTITRDADILAVGETMSFTGNRQLWVYRVNSLGHRIWSAHYGIDAAEECAYDITAFNPDVFGIDIYGIVGYTTAITGRQTPYLLKIFGDGSCYCDRTYYYADDNEGTFREAIVVDEEDLLMVGYINHRQGFGRNDALQIRAGADCNLRWTRLYGGRRNDDAWSIDSSYCMADGGYVMAGGEISFSPTATFDLYLITTDRNGISCITTEPEMFESRVACDPTYVETCEIRWHTMRCVEVEPRRVEEWYNICYRCDGLGIDPGNGDLSNGGALPRDAGHGADTAIVQRSAPTSEAAPASAPQR